MVVAMQAIFYFEHKLHLLLIVMNQPHCAVTFSSVTVLTGSSATLKDGKKIVVFHLGRYVTSSF
jgi:hypothetical protein